MIFFFFGDVLLPDPFSIRMVWPSFLERKDTKNWVKVRWADQKTYHSKEKESDFGLFNKFMELRLCDEPCVSQWVSSLWRRKSIAPYFYLQTHIV